jgi:pimeloyl-ACP methyl ester carboxylesterase
LEGLSDEERERIEEGLAREQVASSPQQLKDAWMDQAPRMTVSEAALTRMLRDVLFRPQMARPRDWGELEALTALAFTEKPVLSIGAELDRAIEPEAARRIAITAPNAELLIFEGCGHFPFAEQPDRYWEAVEGWLLRTAADTAA